MATFDEHRAQQAKKIVSRINLPAQPSIVMEVNKELRQEHPNFQRIASLVTQDASMSAKVINVINSPFFGLSRKVESIIQALTLMGLENFRKVVLTACLQDKLGGSISDQIFWDHSLHAAVAAEAVAKALRSILMASGITPDLAYMAGLFHDIAIPILLEKNPDYKEFTPFALSHKLDIIEEEDKIIGSDHCVVGGLLAKTWSVPEAVCKAIIHHHASDLKSRDNVPSKLISLIQVADYFAYTYEYSIGAVGTIIQGQWDLEEWSDLHEETLNELNLNLEDLEDLKDEIFGLLSH
jgi:putative nucleotidyltransferase with HDIG domain